MELFLQFGYGMMDHSRSLLEDWGIGTVILSPRDLKPEQLQRLGRELLAFPGSAVLLDPQFYLPHADHARLVSHDYWPRGYDSGDFWAGPELRALLGSLLSLNRELGCSQFLLPGLFAPRVDEDWLARQKLVIEEANAIPHDRLPLIATVALGADAIRTDDDIHAVLEEAPAWDVKGVYLVCEHPNGDYLVKDATWMSNLLDLTAGLRLKGKSVIVGYSNQQMLLLAAARVSAIASGTWMNVRSFPPEKFRSQYDEEIKQRTTWYYCPESLSEYKIPYLDIAQKQGVLTRMKPQPPLTSPHAEVLFSGPQPSTLGFSEQAAFRHYLHCLHGQVRQHDFASFDAAVAAQERSLQQAEALIGQLHSAGVRGQGRDFAECVDAGRAALAVLQTQRGPVMRRAWSSLA